MSRIASTVRLFVASSLAPIAGACLRVDDGRDAFVQVAAATFVAGALPAVGDGPAVVAAAAAHAVVAPATTDEPLRATLGTGAEAAAIGARGDTGWWIVPAGPADPLVPGLPTIDATLGFAADTPEGPLEVVVLAADARGLHGAAAVIPFVVQRQTPIVAPLVVSLGWDNDADLDLHVLFPDGIEVWSGNINAYERPAPGEPADPPSAVAEGAVLDIDSNANCVADGRRLENVTWPVEPRPGVYVVRVATSSLCGAPTAQWWVTVRRGERTIATARGRSLPTDTRAPTGVGAGVVAATFTIAETAP